MRRCVLASAVAVASASIATTRCTPELGCVAAEPAWVAKFSTAAPGPEQYWINYGATPDVMVVGWLTANVAPSTVQYGTSSNSYSQTATGTVDFYKYSAKYTSGQIHHATLTGLKPSTVYYYKVAGAATEYNFTSSPGVGAFYPYKIGFFADIGENGDADSTVQHMIAGSSTIDSYVLNGDIAYASGCEAGGCTVWDAFQRMMSPLAAMKPIAINIGNHETYDSANGITAISARKRFAGMPTGGRADDVWYFSYEAGPAHVISISSFYPGGFGAGSALTQWLEADLASIDRAETPWVLVSVHAPWYNSNTEHQGDGEGMRVALEAKLVAAGVAAVFSGHVHSYERSYVVNDKQVVADGKGIVHLNIGDAGASLYTSWLRIPATSAFHSAVFGHGEFEIVNATHALWTWHRNQDNEAVIADQVFVVNTM